MWNWNALSQKASQQNAASQPQQQQQDTQTHQRLKAAPNLLRNSIHNANVANEPTTKASLKSSTTLTTASDSQHTSGKSGAVSATAENTSTTSKDAVESFSGLRIAKRTISAQDVHTELSERKFIPLNRMDVVPKDTFTNEAIDWVTIGVLSRKTISKASSNGGSFMVWSISDLNDTELGVFLFGDAYEGHWKEIEGSIVAVLNATMLPASEKNRFAFKVTEANEIVKLGRAVDFGVCKGLTSGEARCRLAVNTAKSQYCLHHITSKFLQAGKGRQQLNNSLGNFRKNLFSSSSRPKNISAGVYTSATPVTAAASGWHAPTGPGQKRKRSDGVRAGGAGSGFAGGPMRLSASGAVIQHAARPLGSRGMSALPQSATQSVRQSADASLALSSAVANPTRATRGQKIMYVRSYPVGFLSSMKLTSEFLLLSISSSFVSGSAPGANGTMKKMKPKKVNMMQFMNSGSRS